MSALWLNKCLLTAGIRSSTQHDSRVFTNLHVLAWFVGDPHIHTLDNFQYTFNGLGEYTLIKTDGGNFTLQGRTVKALDEKGVETAATVFSAFAASDADSDRVYIAMNSSRSGTCLKTTTPNNMQVSNKCPKICFHFIYECCMFLFLHCRMLFVHSSVYLFLRLNRTDLNSD